MIKNSVLSYPKRGPWGNNKFRGNTTGYLIKDLIEHFKPKNVLDPMCGSGTTRDVCKELKIPCDCYDLSKGFNLLQSPLPAKKYDMIFFHPPYWNIIKFSDDPADLSNCKTFSEYMRKLSFCLERLSEYLSPNGILILQIGDVRKKGKFYPLGAYVQVLYRKQLKDKIIKIQHGCQSNNNFYPGNFIRIMHEEVLCLKNFEPVTWQQLIRRVFEELNATQLTLPEIYKPLMKHPKTLTNPTFQATVRKNIQRIGVSKKRGIWQLH